MRDIGLVFTGGGGKCAYQLGVWKALKDNDLDRRVGAIAGISVGTFNAALFALGSYKSAKSIWTEKLDGKIFRFSQKNKMRVALKSKPGLKTITNDHLDIDKLQSSNIELFAACRRYLLIPKIDYINFSKLSRDEVISTLCASVSFPTVFQPEILNGKKYRGGNSLNIGNSVPIKPIYEAGYRNIIIVYCDHNAKKIVKRKYPDCNIVEIFPSQNLGKNSFAYFDFSPENVRARIQIGYNDSFSFLRDKFPSVLRETYNKSFIFTAEERRRKVYKNNLDFGRIFNPRLAHVKKLLYQIHQNYYLGYSQTVCILCGCLFEQCMIVMLENKFDSVSSFVLGEKIKITTKDEVSKMSLGIMISLSKYYKLFPIKKIQLAYELLTIRNFSIHDILPNFYKNEKTSSYEALLKCSDSDLIISISMQEVSDNIVSDNSSEIWAYYILKQTKNLLITVLKQH